jgi:hypothetical protein
MCRHTYRHRASSDVGLDVYDRNGVCLRLWSVLWERSNAQNTVGKRDCEFLEYLTKLRRCFISLKEKVRWGVKLDGLQVS